MNAKPSQVPKTRIVALANFKGGVGKTTTAVNLAGALILREKRVLLIDLDAQCNASTALNLTITAEKLGTRFLLSQPEYGIAECAYPRGPYLDIVPADPDLSDLEQQLLVAPDGRLNLRSKLASGIDPYDFVLIDCPPSIGALTQCALVAATEVIVPIDVGFFSVEGLARMLSIIEQIRHAYNPNLHLAGILATKYDNRTRLSEQTIEAIQNRGLPVFKTKVRINVDIIRAQMAREPISIYARGSNGDLDYKALADELLPARVIPLKQTAQSS
jgi:chromosome partitioning protein